MAHVLLPCDLPSWPRVQGLLTQIKSSKDGGQVAQWLTKIYEICCVSLDPEDTMLNSEHPGFQMLGAFIDNVLTSDEKVRFLEQTLPDMASKAAALRLYKPAEGFLYSLKKEEELFVLGRDFTASLLANAFFSTFPRRNAKTHPTLQDFVMVDFFQHLGRRGHQRKLKAFLRYFEKMKGELTGHIGFTRKVVCGPSLPGWLCSDRPLVPLIVRPEGCIQEADSRIFRTCCCATLVGGDVLKSSTSQEAKLLFLFPELLTSLCFVESLEDNEALLVRGIRSSFEQDTRELSFCFLDTSEAPGRQLEDSFLLRELNKALAAFLHEPVPVPRRRTPVGESSGSEAGSRMEMDGRWSRSRPSESSQDEEKLCRMSCPLVVEKADGSESRSGSNAYNRAENGHLKETGISRSRPPKIKSESWSKYSTVSQTSTDMNKPSRDEEYYTADEGSKDGSEKEFPHRRRMLRDEGRRSTGDTSSYSGSVGFVLGGDSEEEPRMESHERLEDFRKRIRKRTRRRVSRRSSYAGSSGSSDMEDISEDPEPPAFIRPANSEPSLLPDQDDDNFSVPFSPEAMLSLGGKKVMATSSSGHLKAYSYDGVYPNLPVPFKAKFRRRSHHSDKSLERDSSSFLEGGSSVEDLSYSLDERPESATAECVCRCPVAVEPHAVEGDGNQFKTIILWLAASVAELPALILYTLKEPSLQEMTDIYGRVLSRDWTVGDLSCEVLRFCRNRSKGPGRSLFRQLRRGEPSLKQSFSQHSLD